MKLPNGMADGSAAMPHVIIIGAGISGLSLAYRLQQRLANAEITILEQNALAGGTIRTEECDGFLIEAGPNGFLDTKPSTVLLCRELGLADRLVAASEAAAKNRYLFVDGKLKLLPNSLLSFVTSDLLSWHGKFALLGEQFRNKGETGGDESIDAFVRRRAGKEAAEVLADAMVTGIFAGDPKLLSARACFPRLAALEEEYGGIIKGMAKSAKKRRQEAKARGEPYQRPGKMWSFREGMGLLIETLCEKLKKPPLCNAAVTQIGRPENGAKRWLVTSFDGRSWPADAVVLTCPAYVQAAMLSTFDNELAEEIRAIPYNRVAVIGLGYRKSDIPMSLDGFGFIVPQKLHRDVLGVQWCSSIFPGRAPDDAVLLRAMCGGWHRPDVVAWDDEHLLKAVRSELYQAMGITAEPFFTHIVRWDRAIPQYHIGHLDRVKRIEDRLTAHLGLFVGGNAYHGVAMNDCTEQGNILAEKVAKYLI